MVNTAFPRKLFEQLPTGGCERKGIGYMIEAIVASLTIFIFAIGSISAPPQGDWNSFQNQIEAQDIGYVIEESGHMENFLERSETGSVRTAASTLSNNLEISGNIQNLPIRRSQIGFHVLQDNIYGLQTVDVSSASDNKCHENDDLEEIDNDPAASGIKRTQISYPSHPDLPGAPSHGVYLYIADIDPQDPAGEFNGEEDYDALWVDNGTRCQFSSAEGPHYIDDFFFWGNTSDSVHDDHYDLKNISKDGEKFTVYNSTQVIRFRNTMDKPVNGIETDTHFDTFNFSIQDLDTYSVLVFRRQETLNQVLDGGGSNADRRDRLLDYLETGSAMFLMDLEENDLEGDFMEKTGFEWVDLDWTSRPSEAGFSDATDSGDVETYFLAQSGDDSSVSMLPGGNISSGTGDTIIADEKLVYAGSGLYRTKEWNATNMSMDSITESEAPPGKPETDCTNPYREGTFKFPDNKYYILATHLGTSSSSCDDEVWGLSIDLNDNDEFEPSEGPYVTGEKLEVDNREYTVTVYPQGSDPDCNAGECAEFIFLGSDRIELVNHRTSFEDREIQRFARAEYQSRYSSDERKILASTIYWLAGDETSFGTTESTDVSTSVVGGIKNNIYMPYKVSMRWNQ